GASMAATGLVFMAVTALAVQLAQYPRSAAGLAGLVLAMAFVIRAVGDVTDSALSWLSPFGWAQATRMYVDDRWWPLAIPVLAAGLVTVIAWRMAAGRDLGAGLIPAKPGQTH